MRLTRPRITVRRMMVVVAVLAVTFGLSDVLVQRRERFKAIATRHYRQCFRGGILEDNACEPSFSPDTKVRKARVLPWRTYHFRMFCKYEYASRYPWLPVLPDPPEPNRAKAVVVGPPSFTFSLPINTNGEHSWVIRNEGNDPLLLELARSTGATLCILSSYSKIKQIVIEPGKETAFIQTWKGFNVPVKRREIIELYTNDPENPLIRFTVQGDNY